MTYKISEKSNQGGVIELLMQPSQPRQPWLNVQIDLRNSTNRVVKVKTVDEKSYIVLTPFINSHKEVNAEAFEAELSQFIALQNYGITLLDRKVVRLDSQEPALPAQPQRKLPAPMPKHMIETGPKLNNAAGGKVFLKESIDKRESEDAGLMAYGSAKRAKVVQMFEDMTAVPTQPKAKIVPKLAAKSRLLNNPPVTGPRVVRPISPVLSTIPVIEIGNFQDALPAIAENDEDFDYAIALSLSGAEGKPSKDEPLMPSFNRPSFEPMLKPIMEEYENKEYADDDLNLAIAMSLQEAERKSRPSPSPAPRPTAPSPYAVVPRSVAPSPYPAPSYSAPRLSPLSQDPRVPSANQSRDADQARDLKQLRLQLDEEYAKQLAEEMSQEDLKLSRRKERLDQDMLFAAQLEAEEKAKAKAERERLSMEAIAAIQAQDLLEVAAPHLPLFTEENPGMSLSSVNHSKESLCEIYNIDVDLLNQFENLQLPPLDMDAHVANKTFVRNSRHIVDALFKANADIMFLYQNCPQKTAFQQLLGLLAEQSEYKPNTPYNKAVQFVFGPYATKDREEDETGGVSLKDMLVRISVLLVKNAEIENKAINQTRAFKFLKDQMTDQSSTCFQGAIARIFCAYWAGVRYFYDNLVGSQKKS